MSTFLQLRNQVADFINRSDFDSQIQTAIKTAIRFYERRRWSFNETATALTTSAGQVFLSFPSNFLLLDELRITISGDNIKLNRRDAQWIREANAGSATGQPTDFGIYQNRINLFVIPDSAYSVNTYYIKKLPELSADSDTNSWTTEAVQDLVVYHASKYIWANILRNPGEAAKYAALEKVTFDTVTLHEDQYQIDVLKPTEF